MTPSPRTALLIDGANMFAAAKMLRFHIDYKLLLERLCKDYYIVRANYYTAIRPNDGQDDPLIKLIDWLSFNGYKVVTKPAMEYFNKEGLTVKGNMDIEIAVDALLMSERIEHFILGTGDGDFKYLVDALHRKGLEVSAISTIKTDPPMIATVLRREVDTFLELADMIPYIERKER
jgi:uncharacterized LabA/DUF88 family protein